MLFDCLTGDGEATKHADLRTVPRRWPKAVKPCNDAALRRLPANVASALPQVNETLQFLGGNATLESLTKLEDLEL